MPPDHGDEGLRAALELRRWRPDLMAQGHSNSAIASSLSVGEAAVAKHIGNVFGKLDLAVAPQTHRRVGAVLTYLREAR
ncbi:hypothetical protein BN6_48980 [Saccharothrix espanaensis DSM 44229]|uniref:HTH luxR-type domain-containing protein n=1 Tax=Saccharothrix espanaensis (strain ATCC 51144 / DSM 44229 / JCM 9112 / NBRC 15066 / NRRL 15764) TaxID=1179773 RepID=K0K5N6_SACES|nr:hypothetical protein BN6_48980 [Saccharothrix espanaensis DSM 44229]